MKSYKDFKLTLRYNSKLNPKIWDGVALKKEVATKLKLIASKWADFAKIPNNAIKDIILVGGNANFNYTRYSDIDLHLVVDKDEIADCPDLLDDYLTDKKQMWALTHNIKIKGLPVELYAQDISDTYPKNQGVYSIKSSKWLIQPTKEDIDFSSDKLLIQKTQELMKRIDYLIDNNADEDELEKIKKRLREMRASGIQRGGEWSRENLIFKELRNKGYVKKIIDYIRRSQDDKLSLK